MLRIPPFVNLKGKDDNADWLAGQKDERSVLGHAQINKGRVKGDDPEIDIVQTPKRFDWRLALLEKIQKTFADSIPNNNFRTEILALLIDLIALSIKSLCRCVTKSFHVLVQNNQTYNISDNTESPLPWFESNQLSTIIIF